MDPISILQILSTVIALGDVVLKCITKLRSISAKYQDAPVLLFTMISQLSIVHSALGQLKLFHSPDLSRSPRYQQLALQVQSAMESFEPLMENLQREIDRLDDGLPLLVATKLRISFLWSEREMSYLSTMLDRQVNALSLLLQAIQW